jgi:UPF0716 protein FxsA
MFIRLALLFIVVPIAELALLVEIGRRIGTLPTVALVAGTGLVGAYLTRRQGAAVLRQLRAELTARRVPASHIADGALILLAGALLITPGVLTDAVGFFCLVPGGRRVVKRAVGRWVGRAVQRGATRVAVRQSEIRFDERSDYRIVADGEFGPPGR